MEKIDYKITKAMSNWDEEPTIGDNKGVCYFNYLKVLYQSIMEYFH
jgi:hypothetical protein